MSEFTFPSELKRAIKAIDSEQRYQILELLCKEGEMAYSTILDRLDTNKGSLNYHLEQLMEGGLLNNRPKEGLTNRNRSFYSITQYGHSFISSMMSSFYVPVFYDKESDLEKTYINIKIKIDELISRKHVNYASHRYLIGDINDIFIYNTNFVSNNKDKSEKMKIKSNLNDWR